ncbi:glycosyltransferase [Paenibacillus elgii]|uniref:glycosyltransferase n=1 Tax=Paenibacillus elgii TaxID=189691 RepID=UPI000FDAFA47|nr:glycosyltransferase [Paenibacillus elgii]NEN84310.1 glycosyltransferase [Paenibacillus elgii]
MKKESPLVSVVIPCFNYGNYIKETIDSVLSSYYNNIEIIVVNDGSTDQDTIEVLQQLELNTKLKIIHQDNKGLPAARNTGIRESLGEYILPLDADDLIQPSFITKGVWLLEKESTIGFVYSLVQLFGEVNELWITESFDPDILLHHNYIPATALYRKKMWEQIGGYDESMTIGYEDWEFWIRSFSFGWKGRRINEALFLYRKHGVSMLSDSRLRHNEIVSYIKEKHTNLYTFKWQYKLYNKYVLRKSYKIIFRVLQFFKSFLRKNKFLKKLKKANIKPLNITINKSYNKKILYISGNQDKIQVVFILPWLKVGGVEKVFLDLFKNIDRSRFSITLMTSIKDVNEWEYKFKEVVDQIFHLAAFTNDENEMVQFLLDYVSVNEVQCIHISNTQFGYRVSGMLRSSFPNIKLLDTLHMEEPYEPWDYFRFSQSFSMNFHKRVVITNFLSERLVGYYKESANKVVVIENGISMQDDNFSTSNTKEKKYIVFVGRLVKQKQPLLFIDIAHKVLEMFPETRFLLIGDGPLYKKAKEKIERLGLTNSITLMGYQEKVKQLLLEKASIFIAPSLMEGLPIVGIEAMASKAAVVASDVRGWSDLISTGINGFLVAQDDIHAYAEIITKLMNDDELKQKIVSNAFQTVMEKYTAESMSRKYQDVYDKLI